MIEVGTVCMKIAGREAGKYCVVVEKQDDAFVTVTGPKALTGVRRRKANIAHLEPTAIKLDVAEKAGDAEVERAFSADVLKKLGIEKKTQATKPKKTESATAKTTKEKTAKKSK